MRLDRAAKSIFLWEFLVGFVIITVLLCVGSLRLTDIVEAQNSSWGLFGWYWLPLFPMFIVFFISALAETNRPPFDLVEAESTPYMMFMLGEYVAIATMCAMTTILFLGGYLPPFPVWPLTLVPGVVWFTLKALFVFFMFAMVKAFVPRYRYDQLMRLGWKVFLPLSGGWLPPFDFAPFTWVPGVIWFVLKLCFVFFMFAMVKAFVPRYRYDQLMRLGWKVFLPLSLAMVVIVAGVLQFTGLAPG